MKVPSLTSRFQFSIGELELSAEGNRLTLDLPLYSGELETILQRLWELLLYDLRGLRHPQKCRSVCGSLRPQEGNRQKRATPAQPGCLCRSRFLQMALRCGMNAWKQTIRVSICLCRIQNSFHIQRRQCCTYIIIWENCPYKLQHPSTLSYLPDHVSHPFSPDCLFFRPLPCKQRPDERVVLSSPCSFSIVRRYSSWYFVLGCITTKSLPLSKYSHAHASV